MVQRPILNFYIVLDMNPILEDDDEDEYDFEELRRINPER